MPPTPQDVRNGLLLGGGEALRDPDIQKLIDRAADRVTRLVGSSLAASSIGEDLITMLATARAQRLADAKSGYAESQASKDLNADAKELLTQLQGIAASESQGGGREIDVDEDLIDGPVGGPFWPVEDPAMRPLRNPSTHTPYGLTYDSPSGG